MTQKKKLILYFILILLIFISLQPYITLAQTQQPNQPAPAPQPLSNPLADADPRVIIGRIIGAVLGIIGSIALAIFIYGGFTWMLSGGSPEKVKKGRDMIIWAVLGLAIIFLSYTVVYFVIGAFTGG